MNLELLRGVSAYSHIHECCPWKKVWVNYKSHSPACALCSPGTSQHSFQGSLFLCSSYRQTQWCSLTHSWLVLIFHFLCGGHCGVLFHILFRGWLLSAIFPRFLFWQFSFLPCDMEVSVCTVGFPVPLLLLLYLCGAPGEKSSEGEAGHLPVTQRPTPNPPSKGLNEKKSCKSADKYLWKVMHTPDLLKSQKYEQLVNMSLRLQRNEHNAASSAWLKHMHPLVQFLRPENMVAGYLWFMVLEVQGHRYGTCLVFSWEQAYTAGTHEWETDERLQACFITRLFDPVPWETHQCLYENGVSAALPLPKASSSNSAMLGIRYHHEFGWEQAISKPEHHPVEKAWIYLLSSSCSHSLRVQGKGSTIHGS